MKVSKDYSREDLSLYYQQMLCWTEKDGLCTFYTFDTDPDGVPYATIVNKDGGRVLRKLDDIIELPQFNVLFNGTYTPFYFTRNPIKDHKRGFSDRNSRLRHASQWSGNPVIREWDSFHAAAAIAYDPKSTYPEFDQALKLIQDGYKLAVAFSPKFALAIPFTGQDLVVMRMDIPIGYYRDGVCTLSKRVSFFKEELEQYVPVEVVV